LLRAERDTHSRPATRIIIIIHHHHQQQQRSKFSVRSCRIVAAQQTSTTGVACTRMMCDCVDQSHRCAGCVLTMRNHTIIQRRRNGCGMASTDKIVVMALMSRYVYWRASLQVVRRLHRPISSSVGLTMLLMVAIVCAVRAPHYYYTAAQ